MEGFEHQNNHMLTQMVDSLLSDQDDERADRIKEVVAEEEKKQQLTQPLAVPSTALYINKVTPLPRPPPRAPDSMELAPCSPRAT